MIRRDLWDTVYGRTPSTSVNFSGGELWRSSPSSNPSLWAATDDDEVLAYGDANSEMARKLMMRGRADHLRGQNRTLQAALSRPNVNLFGAPNDDFDKEIQQLVQENQNARIRGFDMGRVQDQKNYALQKEALSRRLQLQNAALDRAKFARDRVEGDREFGRQLANDGFSRRYRASLLAQGAARDKRMADTEATRGYNNVAEQALEMVRDYGMDPEEAIRVFGLEGPEQEVLRSIGGMASQAEADDLQPYLDYLNQTELSRRQALGPDAAHDQRGDPSLLRRFARHIPIAGRFVDQYPKAPGESAPSGRSGLMPLPAESDDTAALMREAAKVGASYDPARGFYSPRVARQVGPSGPAIRDGAPVANSKADLDALRARGYRGKVWWNGVQRNLR
jgi:hypothetical protein